MSDERCSVDGCERPRYAAKTICEPHYRRLRRTGTLDVNVDADASDVALAEPLGEEPQKLCGDAATASCGRDV